MLPPLRIIHIGLGEIGRSTLAALAARPRHATLVAAVDSHPDIAGQSLRTLLSDRPAGKLVPNLRIDSSLPAALKRLGKNPADVALVTTGSTTASVAPTLKLLADAGLHVVSSCEELSYPALRSAALAKELDAYAARRKVAILGTGVNPGFAMDIFALACTAPCLSVDSIKILRSLDAAKRRFQLQKKVAAGMTVSAVKKLIREKKIGHVGLSESIALLAAGLGWKLSSIEEKFAPLAAIRAIPGKYFQIAPGQVRGLWMRGFGRAGKKTVITLDLTMAFDAETFDEIQITGNPSLTVRTTTGFPGDTSTVGMLVNCAATVRQLQPGLRTMLDVFQARSIAS
jgi:2,4-diaminopentanoate dehydrogenase